ncbi:hypothetical protein E2I00_003961, partial [Balaenoptera physalus]
AWSSVALDVVLVLPLETTALILKLRCKVGHLPTSPQTAASAETHVGPELKSTGMAQIKDSVLWSTQCYPKCVQMLRSSWQDELLGGLRQSPSQVITGRGQHTLHRERMNIRFDSPSMATKISAVSVTYDRTELLEMESALHVLAAMPFWACSTLDAERFLGARNKMQFLGGNRRKLRLADDQRNACYPHSLQFYLQPPSGNISLIEFENLAIDRVKLLKAVENLGVSYVKGSEQYQSKLEIELRKLKFSYRENLEDEYEPRRRDHISHFILRLAYCQSEELRRWFIQQEMDLLRFRFSILRKDKIQSFLKDSHLQFEAAVDLKCKQMALADAFRAKISDEEKILREQDIMASSHSLGGVQLELESVYKIPFADALDLFRGRKVYLENGFAYVPLKDIVAIILNEFRTKLSKALAGRDSALFNFILFDAEHSTLRRAGAQDLAILGI